jgi:hypothetical protein
MAYHLVGSPDSGIRQVNVRFKVDDPRFSEVERLRSVIPFRELGKTMAQALIIGAREILAKMDADAAGSDTNAARMALQNSAPRQDKLTDARTAGGSTALPDGNQALLLRVLELLQSGQPAQGPVSMSPGAPSVGISLSTPDSASAAFVAAEAAAGSHSGDAPAQPASVAMREQEEGSHTPSATGTNPIGNNPGDRATKKYSSTAKRHLDSW